jgi:hypothetical protein
MNKPKVTILESSPHDSKIEDGVFFRCACCHKVKATSGNGCTSGYAVMPDNSLFCFECADESQRNDLKDRSKPFVAYVGSDGKRITTWTGGLLMRVTQSWPCQLTRKSHWHGKNYSCIRATDVHGGRWFGRGSPGVAIKLRPSK